MAKSIPPMALRPRINPNAQAMPALGVAAKDEAPNVIEAITIEFNAAAGTKYSGAAGHMGPPVPVNSKDRSQGKKINGNWKQKGIPMAMMALAARYSVGRTGWA